MLIAQITDLHVGGDEVAALYRLDTRLALRAAVDQINALAVRPEICLVTGDIVENGSPREYRLARRELDRLAMPWYAIVGNHDAHAAFREVLVGHFSAPAGSDFIHYALEQFPLRIVALDSVVPQMTYGRLCEERLTWLDTTLGAHRDRPTLVMLHHPPFETRQPQIDGACLAKRERFGAVIARHPQVEAIISGHVHRSIHARVAHAAASACPSTAHQMTLALAKDDPMVFNHEPAGFQLHWWDGPGSWTTHTQPIGPYPGPFSFH